MKPRHAYRAAALRCVIFFVLLPGLYAQQGVAPRHIGVPQDWSDHHIVFTRDGLAQHPDLMYREPRVLHQAMHRWQIPNAGDFAAANPSADPAANSGHSDWKVLLGGRLAAEMFPAKFSFDPAATPDCIKDYVVFGLSSPGVTGGRPNLVAFNNLYSDTVNGGLCGNAGPQVLFAYNITTVAGGRVSTSPFLSEDGTQIGFVESVPGGAPSAIFHVLTWTAGQGTLAAAAAPATMSTTNFSLTANSTTSSPWIDYGNQTVYVGADNGRIYKITAVFSGTPVLAGPPWPVRVVNNSHLTPPVLDSALGALMVGSPNGSLYKIAIATGVVTSLVVGQSGGTTSGIVAPPVVDVTNGTTFVVSANDGTSAVLVEADTASMTQLSKGRIGQGSATGIALNLFEPAFTNQYFNDPSSGDVRLCGTGAGDSTPWQYAFGFTGRTMKTTISFSQQLLTSTAARCTGWTEFFNPHVNGGTDFFFFGLTQDCTAAGLAGGCVVARSSNTTINTVTVNGGPSGIVIDNYSTAAQASSLYLTAQRTNTAYKFTQNGLQ